MRDIEMDLGEHAAELASLSATWRENDVVARIWDRDASVWTGADEAKWLGWLDVVERQRTRLDALGKLQQEAAGFEHAVVLGMGGSSLCPEVLSLTFGSKPGFPKLHVLDSTVPAEVLALEARLDLEKTLFLVASKSGTTAEPLAFERYFFERADASQFVAITDPGTALDEMAREKRYRAVFHGEPEIGGRFSALSHFGMVPATILGLSVSELLGSAGRMAAACGHDTPPEANPGVRLGLALGVLARSGRDKMTLLAAPELAPLGAWIEQLVAESTGKHGKGILPVDREPSVEPDVYGDDRVFTRLSVGEHCAPEAPPGHPVVSIHLDSLDELPAELFRWEMATAVAGAVLGVNPFDQPDVEASKKKTRALIARFEAEGERPRTEGLTGPDAESLEEHLASVAPGDYFAILAYVERSPENDALLQALRARVLRASGAATTLGYGPRFLHSTGQYHKGGPNRGVFVQITADDAEDAPVPGQALSFGALAAFQAQGDLEVLRERGRRTLAIHLDSDVASGLRRLAGP